MEEVTEIRFIKEYLAGAMSLKEICQRFKIHRTTALRKIRRFREFGPAGLAHGLLGRPSNNARPAADQERICGLYEREYRHQGVRLWDFYHRIVRSLPDRISYSTLRRWMLNRQKEI